jgi:hypothetical protein
MIQPPVSNINPHPVYDYSAYTGAAPTASSYVNPNAGIGACSNLVSGLSSVASCTLGILNAIIPIIVALTVVWIIWGAFGLTKSEGEDRKKWRDVILYGIVGLFVMVSIYGLVHILTGTFGLTGGGLPPVHINFQ